MKIISHQLLISSRHLSWSLGVQSCYGIEKYFRDLLRGYLIVWFHLFTNIAHRFGRRKILLLFGGPKYIKRNIFQKSSNFCQEIPGNWTSRSSVMEPVHKSTLFYAVFLHDYVYFTFSPNRSITWPLIGSYTSTWFIHWNYFSCFIIWSTFIIVKSTNAL